MTLFYMAALLHRPPGRRYRIHNRTPCNHSHRAAVLLSSGYDDDVVNIVDSSQYLTLST